jgi:hypothetical protein
MPELHPPKALLPQVRVRVRCVCRVLIVCRATGECGDAAEVDPGAGAGVRVSVVAYRAAGHPRPPSAPHVGLPPLRRSPPRLLAPRNLLHSLNSSATAHTHTAHTPHAPHTHSTRACC